MQAQVFKGQALGFTPQNDYEYLLVINPVAEVYGQVMEEKQQFYNTYKEKAAIKTKPHITVANFLAKEEMEGTIIRYMHRILGAQKTFDVMLNNYSGFPPHTIYIRVQQPEPFKQLADALRAVDNYVRSNGYPAAHLITKPHVTIARRLHNNIYSKAMTDYSQKIFNASFTVNELVLLKRQNQFDACQQVTVFKLANYD
jgi:2'-5' RNA ligase